MVTRIAVRVRSSSMNTSFTMNASRNAPLTSTVATWRRSLAAMVQRVTTVNLFTAGVEMDSSLICLCPPAQSLAFTLDVELESTEESVLMDHRRWKVDHLPVLQMLWQNFFTSLRADWIDWQRSLVENKIWIPRSGFRSLRCLVIHVLNNSVRYC
jgi:hypothetical protein